MGLVRPPAHSNASHAAGDLLATTGWRGAQNGNPATFEGAWEATSAEYQAALRTLETQGRDETAAAVERQRQSFQQLAERFVADPPPHLAGDPNGRPSSCRST